MNFLKSVTFVLIAINVLVFFIELGYPPIIDILGLTPTLALQGAIWQFITYMFVHGGFMHLFFNMFGLLIFGPTIEQIMGKKKFIIFYLICGIASGLLHIGLEGINDIVLIGASGAVFGVLAAYGIMFPKRIIYFNFIPMPAIVFIIIYALLEFLYGMVGIEAGIAHFGHLGGMIAGIILVKFFGFGKKKVKYFWE